MMPLKQLHWPVWAFVFSFPALASGDDRAQPQLREEAPSAPACRIKLDFGKVAYQDLTIKGDKIKGANFNLQQEGKVLYGFVLSKPTRFRVSGKEISGSIAGMDLMLHIKRTGPHIQISGLVGSRRVSLKASDFKVEVQASASGLASSSAHLLLVHERGNRMRGRAGAGAEIYSAQMISFGCNMADLRKRPELLVVLFMWWLGA